MNQKNNLVKNASFLMIAAMISKVIGLLYKSPLSNIIGSLGMGYTSLAQNAYMILLMIASFSIPQAVSKLISERIALKDYRNAHKFFKGAMIYAMVIGGVVGLFCLFGAGLIIPQNQKDAIPALQILAPTIFLSGILGVFRGYFQAYRNMMPTSISQIIEQVFNAAVSLLAAWGFINAFSDGTENSIAKWGAAGSTVGTGAGVVTALAFMLLVYGVNRRKILHRVERDHRHQEESYKEIFRVIILVVSPIILSAFVYNVNAYINGYLFSDILGRRGGDAAQIGILYAEYATYFMTIINIPLTLSSTAPTSMIPEVSAHYAMHDIEGANMKTDRATWISMLISIPAAVGLAVLSGPITRLIFPGTNGVGGQLLILGGITIILNGNSNITNGVLQGIGKPKLPMIHAAIALVADVIAMALLLVFTNLGVYTIVIAQIVYAVVMCLLNDRSIKKYMGYKNPWRSAYLSPFLASIPMGVVAGVVYYGLYALIHSNVICLGISVILAACVYFIVYLFVSKPGEEELGMMPGGRYMKKLARMMKII